MVNTSLFRACVFVAVCGSVSIVNAQETTGAAAAASVAQQSAAKADGDAVVTTHHSPLTRAYWWAESKFGGSKATLDCRSEPLPAIRRDFRWPRGRRRQTAPPH